MKRFFIIYIFFFLLWANKASAVTIGTKSGKIIEGDVVEKTEEYIKVQAKDNFWKIPLKELDGKTRDLVNSLPTMKSTKEVVPEEKGFQHKEVIKIQRDQTEKTEIEKSPELKRGYDYLDKDMFDEAIKEFDKAIQLTPDFGEAYFCRGNAYVHKNDCEKAIADLTKSIELGIKDAYAAYENRSQCYSQKGEVDKAMSDVNQAIRLNPNYYASYHSRALIFFDQGETEKALADFNQCIKLSPKFAAAYYNRGNIYLFKKSDFDSAIADFSKAINLNQGDGSYYINRSIAYFRKGEYNKAEEDVKEAKALGAESHPEFLKMLESALKQ